MNLRFQDARQVITTSFSGIGAQMAAKTLKESGLT